MGFVGSVQGWNEASEPKRPVRPSSGLDGTDGGRPMTPGTDGYQSVRPKVRPGRTGGDYGCLRWDNLCNSREVGVVNADHRSHILLSGCGCHEQKQETLSQS